MNDDPILTEVHRVKDSLAAKHGYDARKLVKALQQSQKKRSAKMVSFTTSRARRSARDGSTAA